MPPKSQVVKRAMVGMDKAKVDEVSECRERGYLLTTKRIGSGSFSKVYLGFPTQEKIGCNFRLAVGLRSKRDNMVAIKIIPISQTLQHHSRRCLSREINALQTTYKHPNVIQLYETFRSPSRLYLVLELASQGDLLEHINRISDKNMALGLHEGEAKQLFHQLVGAVSHCHNKHIVHRDLKCENILLDETGCVKLTDFGLATRCRKNGLMSTFCGSMPYTAPEILQGQKYQGEHADIWSMGVILYAMVTGKLPFTEFQPSKLLGEIKSGVLYHEHLSTGGNHPVGRSPKGRKVLVICDPSLSKLKLKMAAARQVSPGNGSPHDRQEMLICPPNHKQPPSSADKPVKLFTHVPRPPTAAKPARSFKRPVSASLQNPGLIGKLLGSQEGLRCIRLSKSSQRINLTEQYLPRRLKGF
ncbi:testis-specific serine/threonine-protein kinase 5-like isoform X2 [Scyliorhinus torazame]|uniref:testis-specific serine/threonine-protein kinase 5-like isoform X2 n=1 Tax=Scyliorhinus torazame TaxID=75743 RepID=UPI003B59FC0C